MPPDTMRLDRACGHGGLIRRAIADGDLAFFTTWCLAGTAIQTLVSVEGHRWAIKDSFETIKNELGGDHNETRSWHGWHRHVSRVMLAFAMMAAIRQHVLPQDDFMKIVVRAAEIGHELLDGVDGAETVAGADQGAFGTRPGRRSAPLPCARFASIAPTNSEDARASAGL